jgi:hypothetical protein
MTTQSSLKGFLQPQTASASLGKRASSAIDLDGDDDVGVTRPRKVVRATPLQPSAPAEQSHITATAPSRPRIEAFELPLDATRFHTLAAPSFAVEDAFSSSENAGRQITKPKLDLLYVKAFLVAPGRKHLYDWLLSELPWYRVRPGALWLGTKIERADVRAGLLRDSRHLDPHPSLHLGLWDRRRAQTLRFLHSPPSAYPYRARALEG